MVFMRGSLLVGARDWKWEGDRGNRIEFFQFGLCIFVVYPAL